MTDDKRSPEYRQARREARDQHDAERLERIIAAHTRRLAAMGGRVFPSSAGLHAQARAAVVAWCGSHPDRGATIQKVSVHEAGHFVAATKLGLAPTCARIFNNSGGARHYGGECSAAARPVAPEADGPYTADDVEREAAFALAGPLAEWWVAGGDPYAIPSELLEPGILAAHTADMLGLGRVHVLDDVFTVTMRIVVTFRQQIEQIAGILKRERTIFLHTRGLAKALNGIGGCDLTDLLPLSPEQDVALGEMMFNAPVDLARFTSEIGR